MTIETIEIAGMGAALKALRLPFGKEERSFVGLNILNYVNEKGQKILLYSTVNNINPKDIELMSALVRRGDEHAKVVRGIVVWAKITAPVYFFVEQETYRAGHERLSSESTMHIDCKGLVDEELQKAKAAIPMGKELTKIDYFSYQCLRNIVKQRHNHRLPEWHQFVDWVKTLPFADELILTGIEL